MLPPCWPQSDDENSQLHRQLHRHMIQKELLLLFFGAFVSKVHFLVHQEQSMFSNVSILK